MKRPILKLPLSPGERVLEAASIAALLVMLFIVVTRLPALSPNIPTHFGISGQPDNWGSKNTLLWFPLIGLFIYALFTVLSRFPHLANYPVPITEQNAERQYRIARTLGAWLKLESIGFFIFFELVALRAVATGVWPLTIALTMAPGFIILATIIIGITQFFHAR